MAISKTEPGHPAGPTVEVVYALADVQSVVRLALPPAGMTAGQAITASGLRSRHPELARDDLTLGIFGKTCELTRVLQPGDRVEIYRSLRNDPRAQRRARAAAAPMSGRSMKNKPGVTR